MSITAWLLNNLDGRMVLSVPKPAQAHALKTLEFNDIEPRLSFLPGGRHERIDQAIDKCVRWKLEKPQHVFVFVRPAYELMRSYYQYLQRPRVASRMSDVKKLAQELSLSQQNFSVFAAESTIMGKGVRQLLNYYRCSDPDVRLDIVPLEQSMNYLKAVFSSHENCGRMPLPKRNRSREKMDFDPEAAEIITKRFVELQRVYDKALRDWPALAKQL